MARSMNDHGTTTTGNARQPKGSRAGDHAGPEAARRWREYVCYSSLCLASSVLLDLLAGRLELACDKVLVKLEDIILGEFALKGIEPSLIRNVDDDDTSRVGKLDAHVSVAKRASSLDTLEVEELA
mmetsp:Transcript_14596/g.26172  ORF Transcript_14596/g.26172 Transcript_14596/m.26172 type:complete len:126 (+) Transcript_14596:55-432(+)